MRRSVAFGAGLLIGLAVAFIAANRACERALENWGWTEA